MISITADVKSLASLVAWATARELCTHVVAFSQHADDYENATTVCAACFWPLRERNGSLVI